MAKASEDLTPKKRPLTKAFTGILFALMALSLLSFGVGGFGGRTTRIGTVGDQDIKVNDYINALRANTDRFSQMLGQPVLIRDAIAAGIDKQTLAQVVARAALDDEMDKVGLSASDLQVAAELGKIPAFQSLDGQFDRAAYAFALKSADMTEAEFEKTLRADLARGALQRAITGGITAPDALTDTLFSYAGEMRSFTYLPLSESDLTTPIAAPTDADLQGEYDANIAAYTRPEAKRISYVALLPDTLAPDTAIDETAIQALYDSRADQYLVPEKRLVERLVYPSDADAAAAKAQFDAGTSFDDLVKARGLTLEDVDMGDVSQAELDGAGAAVFALTAPGVVGPLQSNLGPALFRMNAILPAQQTSLEQARPDLLLELQTDAARRDIAARIDAIDDALAGGATLEDLAQTEGLTVQTTDYAAGANDNDPIANYVGFRRAAGALALGDFPEATILDDGGVVAMTLVETVPPTPRPLAQVRDQVAEAWRAEQLSAALSALGAAKLAEVTAGANIASLGTISVAASVLRNAGTAPAQLITAAFAMQPGDVQLVDQNGVTALIRLDAITPANDTAQRAALQAQLAQSLSADVFDIYTNAIQSDRTLAIDQGVIDAIHTQMGN